MISFFPFPYPVVTPLGEGYAIYVTPAPMYENDQWCVQLDDGRILHFSTNQLTSVPNATYGVAVKRPVPEPNSEPVHYINPALRPARRESFRGEANMVAGTTHRYAIRHDGAQALCGKKGEDIVLLSGEGYTCAACRGSP